MDEMLKLEATKVISKRKRKVFLDSTACVQQERAVPRDSISLAGHLTPKFLSNPPLFVSNDHSTQGDDHYDDSFHQSFGHHGARISPQACPTFQLSSRSTSFALCGRFKR